MCNEKDREIKGMAILAKGDLPMQLSREQFIVPSQSGNGKYKVSHIEGWTCSCPDYMNRKLECKHIKATQFFLKLRNSTEVEDFPINEIAEETEKPICPECKSVQVIRVGQRKNKNGVKQKLQCKECKAYFVGEPLKYVKGSAKIVTLTLDLYYKGLSLRDISDTIFQFYGLRTHHETIRRWINTFTKKIDDYTSKQKATVGKTFHTDEQFLKDKGKLVYAYNTIDKDTRFILASTLTKDRGLKETRRHFKDVKAQTDCKPEFVITDKLPAYRKAVKREFNVKHSRTRLEGTTQHVSIVGQRKVVNNNLVERYHNEFREFDKVRRGFKDFDSIQNYLNGRKVFHNYIHEHPAIGTTPAQAAGIELNLSRNKWESLLRKSVASLQENK